MPRLRLILGGHHPPDDVTRYLRLPTTYGGDSVRAMPPIKPIEHSLVGASSGIAGTASCRRCGRPVCGIKHIRLGDASLVNGIDCQARTASLTRSPTPLGTARGPRRAQPQQLVSRSEDLGWIWIERYGSASTQRDQGDAIHSTEVQRADLFASENVRNVHPRKAVAGCHVEIVEDTRRGEAVGDSQRHFTFGVDNSGHTQLPENRSVQLTCGLCHDALHAEPLQQDGRENARLRLLETATIATSNLSTPMSLSVSSSVMSATMACVTSSAIPERRARSVDRQHVMTDSRQLARPFVRTFRGPGPLSVEVSPSDSVRG